jgi:hypothetical protein
VSRHQPRLRQRIFLPSFTTCAPPKTTLSTITAPHKLPCSSLSPMDDLRHEFDNLRNEFLPIQRVLSRFRDLLPSLDNGANSTEDGGCDFVGISQPTTARSCSVGISQPTIAGHRSVGASEQAIATIRHASLADIQLADVLQLVGSLQGFSERMEALSEKINNPATAASVLDHRGVTT